MSAAEPVQFDKQYLNAPESVYAPGYFWIINGKMEEEKLFAQLDEMAAAGAKSVCFHPFPKEFRPGSMPSEMEPGYLTDAYMDMVLKVMDHAETLGMSAWLYDEGGWPSGRCLGRVAEADPKKFAYRVKQLEKDGTVTDQTIGGNSMLESGTVEKFIELTHEKWAEKCQKHFGKTLAFAFTDEPNVWSFVPGETMAWGEDFAEQFQTRKGYDITPYIPALLSAGEPSDETARVRIDYCDVRADLFLERYLLPLQAWCKAHGLLSGGHLNGEDEPLGNLTYGYGHILRSLRAMDVPGVDVIWRQLYPGKEDNRPFPRYASSAAHHIGSKYALAELFGIYGDGMSPEKMKWLIDYNMVRGINLLVYGYYIYEPAKGFMASLHPNFNGNSIWPFMEPLHRYSAAVCSILSKGSPCADIGVLFDVHGIWTGGKHADDVVAKHLELARKMEENQQDYDFIDDEQIAAAEITADGRIAIGPMAYSTLVLPTANWLTAEAKAKLDEFQKNGGKLLDAETAGQARSTCQVVGSGKANVRVTKRLFADGVAAYFLVNESAESAADVTITLAENAPLAYWRPQDGKLAAIDSTQGTFSWTFAPCGSLLVLTGVQADLPVQKAPASGGGFQLKDGWTLRKDRCCRAGQERLECVKCEEASVQAELGDWRRYLGEDFSGTAIYEISFDSPAEGNAVLELGRVASCADVMLNGERLPLLSFGPFRYEVRLKKGENKLAVTVGNTMANALDGQTRARIISDFPPESPYNSFAVTFNALDMESGLFGPVSVKLEH